MGEGACLRVEAVEPTAEGAHPEGAPAVFEDCSDAVLAQALRITGVGEDAIASFEKQTDETMKVMTFVMTLFATAIAIAIVYNNARVALSMRSRLPRLCSAR